MAFLDWFRKRLSTQKASPLAGQRKNGAHAMPKAHRPRNADSHDLAYETRLEGRIVDGGPGKNVFVRNRYLREDTGTHETLKIIDDSILDDEEEFGGDPYNTGSFDRSKSWSSSRSRN